MGCNIKTFWRKPGKVRENGTESLLNPAPGIILPSKSMLVLRNRTSRLHITLLAAYLIFFWLMVRIVMQYLPAGTDTAFLGIKQEYVSLPLYLGAFYIHVFTAILALPAGLTQFSNFILRNYPLVHRINGRLYVISIVLLGAPSGFFIGLFANGGLYSRISFCLLGIMWFWFTWQAFQKARQGKFVSHKNFIYRSFALTLSAITLRFWKYLIIATLHPHPMDAYRIVAWLGWIPNILIAEYLIRKKTTK
jgi:uncharacterized membrane protein